MEPNWLLWIVMVCFAVSGVIVRRIVFRVKEEVAVLHDRCDLLSDRISFLSDRVRNLEDQKKGGSYDEMFTTN